MDVGEGLGIRISRLEISKVCGSEENAIVAESDLDDGKKARCKEERPEGAQHHAISR